MSNGDKRNPVPEEPLWPDLENWFTYHPPEGDDPAKYENIRAAGKELAYVIVRNTPHGADRMAAIRKVREAVMTANAAIACKGT
jgi:hypothetical protein